MTTTIIYEIFTPWSNGIIRVYTFSEMGYYEYDIQNEMNQIIKDSRMENEGKGLQYGIAEIALRDALIWASDPGC